MTPPKPAREGSFVLLNYSIKDADTGELYDTNIESVARSVGRSDVSGAFTPLLIVIGEGRFLPNVEKSLIGMEEGEEKTLDLSAEEAYGPYDKSKLRVLSMGRLKKSGIKEVHAGDVIEIGDKRGLVKAVSGGRVQLDFNHPLAGKSLGIEINILRILRKRSDKVIGLASDSFGVSPERFSARLKGGLLEIDLPPLAYSKKDCYLRKLRFLSRVMKYMQDVKEVRFAELFRIPEEERRDSSSQL